MAMKQLRVLVVEDDPFLRELLVEIMTSFGHEVETAGDGEEALRYLSRNETPPLIIADYQMPNIDGLALTRHIKAAKPAGVRVIVVSGNYFDEVERAAYAAGADRFLQKPFTIGKLQAAIAGLFPD